MEGLHTGLRARRGGRDLTLVPGVAFRRDRLRFRLRAAGCRAVEGLHTGLRARRGDRDLALVPGVLMRRTGNRDRRRHNRRCHRFFIIVIRLLHHGCHGIAPGRRAILYLQSDRPQCSGRNNVLLCIPCVVSPGRKAVKHASVYNAGTFKRIRRILKRQREIRHAGIARHIDRDRDRPRRLIHCRASQRDRQRTVSQRRRGKQQRRQRQRQHK